MDPLVASGIITNSECQTVFSNIKELAEINRAMAQKFDNRKSSTLAERKDLDSMLVGDIFCEMVRFVFLPLLARRAVCQSIKLIV